MRFITKVVSCVAVVLLPSSPSLDRPRRHSSSSICMIAPKKHLPDRRSPLPFSSALSVLRGEQLIFMLILC
jgi:hypothetical protein